MRERHVSGRNRGESASVPGDALNRDVPGKNYDTTAVTTHVERLKENLCCTLSLIG